MCAANVTVEIMSFDELLTSLQNCVIAEDPKLERVFDKLSECSRSDVKRTKERILDEAAQLLKTVNLHVLARDHLELVVRLLVCLQLQMVHISTACRKVDQMLQCLAIVDHQLVFGEIHACLSSIVHSEQIFSHEHLQRACMFLEVSSVGRDVWRELCPAFLDKLAKFFPLIVQQEPLRDGQLCYMAVKVCLQIFQLLSREVSFAVWVKKERSPAMKKILQVLAEIIFGQSCSRDTRLLAGTAMAMLINTASESSAGAAAAWGLFQSSHLEPWLLTVGALQVQCCPTSGGALGQLAMSRGLLTCCQPHILLSSCAEGAEGSLLLDALFPLLYDLCEEKLNCHYLAFEVFTLWLKKVKECLPDIWKMTGGRFLPDDSILQQKLISVIWTSAESPVEGVSDCARVTFSLLLDFYDMDCEQFGHTKKPLYLTLLHRIIQLPWESKAKYHRLCALLPYLGTDTVLDHYAEIPNHLLKCMSNDHLSPCGSELYKCLIQQQRKELSGDTLKAPSESDLGNKWAERWLPVLLEALTSNIVILQNNSSTHLLPCTFQVFPSAVEPLLASLDPFSPGHLCAWAFIMSSYRAVTGSSPWVLQGSSTLKILQLALGSADDNIRLAALNLLCCSLKTKEIPTPEELSIMRTFIPQNLNSESSLFRQHFQAAVRRFLVRIRDGCLAHIKQQRGKGNSSQMESSQEILALGIGFVDWLSQLVCCNLTPNHSYQRKKTVLLLLSALLETCTDTWSPDKRKGQPPVDMGSLLTCATSRGQWDFFSREKLLVLISCLEDSTNEIRELSAGLLVRFFPSVLPADVAAALLVRTKQLLRSPRVQQAQMGALMMKVLHHKWQGLPECQINSAGASSVHNIKASSFARFLVNELKDHYLTAKADVMLSARTKPMHGVLSALQKCLLDDRCSISDSLDSTLITDLLSLLKNISLLLLGMLHGQQETESDAPPSFCDMGNAISSLIAHASEDNLVDGGEECVLLSEEHSLVLTCCWVSLKETGIFLGSLVEKILSESKPDTCFLTKQQLETASVIFRLILLKCRHWGAVEGCSVGFTRYCSALLSSSEPEFKDIPSKMLQQVNCFYILTFLNEFGQHKSSTLFCEATYCFLSFYLFRTLADFLPPLFQLSASPIYSVRVMASKALVAMTPPSEYVNILINLTARLPRTPERCCHNWLHGQLLHIKALLDRTLGKDCVPAAELHAAVSAVEASLWLATDIQRCPLVRAAYVTVVESLRRFCCETFLSTLFDVLIRELRTPKQGLQVGLFSFHQRAIQLLGTEPKWAPDLLETFRTASCDLRLTLITWVVEDHASLNTHFKELIQSVLQSGLREALLSPIAEYRRAHVAAFVGVMATEDPPPPQVPLEESVLLECLDLLLRDLEDQRGGSEFLSQALHGASLLLSQCSQDSLIQRWCGVMETHRSPDAAEVLRISCAEALCVAGLPLTSHKIRKRCFEANGNCISCRLLNTGLYLLQDQSQQVRTKAARFISMLHHARGGGAQRSLYLMQVNLAIPLLLELLLEECWDIPSTLEVLLCHVPHSDLRSVLSEIADSGCGSLYEQDDANVFAEPSVMSEYVLPYLLLMAEKYSESSAMAQRLSTWAEENAAPLLDNLTLCKSLQPAEMLTLLTDPRFHNTLCGLLTRATFLLHLSKTCDRLQHLCDPSALQMTLKDICTHLSEQGVHLKSSLASAVAGDLRLSYHGLSILSKDR
ncbi:thyroid adenoma-associated protein homolog [Hippocampus comes]|uniref:thyroid adenoma-associated protein homolog n=1 Tax=Hippocampus comes TaxID=109280 RepID=UPI00094ED22D|nr:PREDICTED: thyroid adenoma-associated protein homolog [Hippocampus comes]